MRVFAFKYEGKDLSTNKSFICVILYYPYSAVSNSFGAISCKLDGIVIFYTDRMDRCAARSVSAIFPWKSHLIVRTTSHALSTITTVFPLFTTLISISVVDFEKTAIIHRHCSTVISSFRVDRRLSAHYLVNRTHTRTLHLPNLVDNAERRYF